uniref:dUTP diphosphatase n=1 Tax=Trachysalambria curvirostris majanivirus TaxID=2984281 RepID=A0A9C7BQW9_9VIRU|nr:MAG: dUTPase [Trachysalambria curvirostris majanivirus]
MERSKKRNMVPELLEDYINRTHKYKKDNTPLVLFKKLDKRTLIPKKNTCTSAGYDIWTIQKINVPPNSFLRIPVGFAMDFQSMTNCYGQLALHSSLALKFVSVAAGIIDRDYDGQITVVLFNYATKKLEINPGEWFAQVLFIKIETPSIFEVRKKSSTGYMALIPMNETQKIRGNGGFGSTGIKGKCEDPNITKKENMSDPSVLFRKLDDSAVIPKRATLASAGYDISTKINDKTTIIPPNSCLEIATGLVVDFKRLTGCYGQLAIRSSTAIKFVSLPAGVIDRDYEGEIIVMLFNHAPNELQITPGERFAQLLFIKIETPPVYEIKSEPITGRTIVIPIKETSNIKENDGFGSNSTKGQFEDSIIHSKDDISEASVFFLKLDDSAVIPKRVTLASAGYDLSTKINDKTTIIPPNGCLEIATGLVVDFKRLTGCYGQLIIHPSLAKSSSLPAGVIEKDYEGEIKVILLNHTSRELKIAPGEKFAQLLFIKKENPLTVSVDGVFN